MIQLQSLLLQLDMYVNIGHDQWHIMTVEANNAEKSFATINVFQPTKPAKHVKKYVKLYVKYKKKYKFIAPTSKYIRSTINVSH